MRSSKTKRTIKNSGNLAEERSNPFRALWDLNVKELLDSKRVAEFVCHWGSCEGLMDIT